MSSGIYEILNPVNGKRYVGSAMNFQHRWTAHLSALRCGRHHNPHLQHAFDKYGEDALVFSVLEEAQEEPLLEREQHYMDMLKSEYNIAPIAGNPMLGRHHSLETRGKISEAKKGRHHSDEHRRKNSEAHMDLPVSAATRAKLSLALMGERNHNYGKPLSPETRQKISEAKSGERHHFYGKHHSLETRAKISAAKMGHLVSAETRLKISLAMRGNRNGLVDEPEKEGRAGAQGGGNG